MVGSMIIHVTSSDFDTIEAYVEDHHDSFKLSFGDVEVFMPEAVAAKLPELIRAATADRGTLFGLHCGDNPTVKCETGRSSFYDLPAQPKPL